MLINLFVCISAYLCIIFILPRTDAFGTRLEDDDPRTFDERVLDIQPSVTTDSFNNNFQYSYTKFLNERLSREEYKPAKEAENVGERYSNIETSAFDGKEKTLSTKPFKVRTETDLYGSLNSGKIYQTAVNEPISVLASAEYTVMKFDSVAKHAFKKFAKDKSKKMHEAEPRKLSDLMLKIVALFKNDSKVNLNTKSADVSNDSALKNKSSKRPKNRKLLSITDAELIQHEKMQAFKRSIENVETEISHEPLVHSPTVPYMPQSNIHTTGIVMSTTGTDIIGGRTTEWTTIVEGTFISGTYAHIVHSTSRIYYTVDTPLVTTESTKLDKFNTASITLEAIELSSISAPTESSYFESDGYTKESSTKKLMSRSQRTNDKSLRALDAFINDLSSSKVTNEFLIDPTATFSTFLDIITIDSESKTEIDATRTNSMITSLPSHKESNLNTLPNKRNESVKDLPSNTVEISLIDSTSVDDAFITATSFAGNDSDIVSIEMIKNVDFANENPLMRESELEVSNLVGRMANVQDPEGIFLSSSLNTINRVSGDLNVSDSIHSTSTTFFEEDVLATSLIPNNMYDISPDDLKKLSESSIESLKNAEILSSKTINKETFDESLFNTEKEQIAPMGTSLGIPDVTDLFVIFSHEPFKSSEIEMNSNSEKVFNTTTQIDSISPTSSTTFYAIPVREVEDPSKVIPNNPINIPDAHTEEFFNSENQNISLSNSEITIKEPSLIGTVINDMHSTVTPDVDNLDKVFFKDINLSVIATADSPPNGDSEVDHDRSVNSNQMNESAVMVFLGIASTLGFVNPTQSSLPSSSVPVLNENVSKETEEISSSESESSKLVDHVQNPITSVSVGESTTSKTSDPEDVLKHSFNDDSAVTVLILPSMNLEELKNLMVPPLSSSMLSLETTLPENLITESAQDENVTPALNDYVFTEDVERFMSKLHAADELTSFETTSDSIEETRGRAKRAVSESVTILRPGGRIVSTDARVYLTPTTHYTTYTYFTTVLIPGGGTEIRSSLHVDSVILEPTDRAVYGYDEHGHVCDECRIRNTAVYDSLETRYAGRPLGANQYHVETVPYDISRASEITHRTTYTYFTTRIRAGTPFVETRKETKTDVKPLPTGRYSPFEIGTYYDGDFTEPLHYHTEIPYIGAAEPHDHAHRTTYTYYTTRLRNGVPIVETRRETNANITPIRTYYRPGQEATQAVRTRIPTYYQTIDPNLNKPDKVTHRTTYTYHTTRFRDGVPIVNTRKETDTNVTPIPTYTRPVYNNRQTAHRIVPSRPATHNVAATETYYPYNRQGTNPQITHRTTYTYYTTRLRGGSTHVDTRYVTETNVTPNPSVPYVRGTTHAYPHGDNDDDDDNDYYDGGECRVCRESGNQRSTATRYDLNDRGNARVTLRPSRRSQRIEAMVQPSTATLYSTYTYATTQLTRGGIPVVRTREHTVTEVLSDVVLPTLKFGDRIRAKRTVKPEDKLPKNTDHVHVVPVRHTFSRTRTYADGRQGRRIQINDNNPNRVHVANSQQGNTPYSRIPNSNSHNDFEIQPTNVTFYSTYTYFTTELSDGRPVVKTREHTVTEILTDVIVPTVSSVRHASGTLATRVYRDSSHHRRERNAIFLENKPPSRQLLSELNYSEHAHTNNNNKDSDLEPSELSNDNSVKYKSLKNMMERRQVLQSSQNILLNGQNPTPQLQALYSNNFENIQDDIVSRQKNNNFRVLENEEDLIPEGAEARMAIVPSPVTHYTTFTYYTTKLKPGGSRVIDTSTRVSSSVTYPDSPPVYERDQSDRNLYKRKLYRSRSSEQQEECCGKDQRSIYASPVSQIAKTRYPANILNGHVSQSVSRSSNSFRGRQDSQRTCPNCHNRGSNQRIPQLSGSQNRITRIQKDNFLTRIPVRNGENIARRVPDGAPNHIAFQDSHIQPTHVTYYSTYTYFTTEPVDGTSVVRSREHTVTEVLTDVIVPTVVSLNQVQSTPYANYLRRREKRHNAIEYQNIYHAVGRKLLSLDKAEIFTNDSFLFKSVNNSNFATSDNVSSVTQDNFNSTKNILENVALLYSDDKKNISEKVSIESQNGTEELVSFRRSEILNNETSQLFEVFHQPVLKNNSNFEELISVKNNKTGNYQSINTANRNFSGEAGENSEVSSTEPLPDKSNFEVVMEISEENVNKNVEASLSETSINQNNLKILPTSTLNVFKEITKVTELVSEGISSRGSLKEHSNLENSIKPIFDTSRNDFLYLPSFLAAAEPSFSRSTIDASFSISETPRIEKLELTDLDKFIYPTRLPTTLDNADIFSSEDLYAEGAEVRYAVAATPTTHYTTYTYYSTILKPGGSREIITNTKVAASTYYPDTISGRDDTHYHRNVQKPSYSYGPSKIIKHDAGSSATKFYDMFPERAVVRNQYAPPPRTFRSYKPEFKATQYEARTIYKENNGCLSCNKQYDYNKNAHNRYNDKLLTSLPVRRTPTQRRIVNTNTNTIPYIEPEIKPTRVTFYSTYTYFTTELQNGSPVVRSREHTVTEILTDVIVPTVTAVAHARQSRYHNARGKREVPEYQYSGDFHVEQSPLGRKILSVEENEENIEMNSKTLELDNSEKTSKISDFEGEKMSVENISMTSFEPQLTSVNVPLSTATASDIKDNILSNDQFSKAFEAYLAFLETSGSNPSNLTLNDSRSINLDEAKDELNLIKPTKQLSEPISNFELDPIRTTSKSMTSVVTSDVTKNGRITKFTTTIFGTYINGVYAQRAKSRSDIIPITEMGFPTPDTTVMFNPSRLPGLVRSIVSRKVRGPIAVHLTTEIHGTFVGGAYAQTARVFTSSQPLSSTRETPRHRLQSYTSTILPQGTRKTGLLSTRILRSKVDGSKTLLFVSEIYGTHIGGAYAHMGTYTTRTVIQSTSTIAEPEPTSTVLPTYYIEDLTTGLVTASVSEKSLNGTTTRYHYEVYGTYLDGTYAHVPSISTETLSPHINETLPNTPLHTRSFKPESSIEFFSKPQSDFPLVSKSLETNEPKIGLIHASTRAHETNGTTTQHIFEVHGTYLNGNYAHVPSVSVVTITPSKTLVAKQNIEVSTEISSTEPVTDFEVLTIFSDVKTEDSEAHSSESTTLFSDFSFLDGEIIDIIPLEKLNSPDNSDNIGSTIIPSLSDVSLLDVSENSDRNEQSANFFPVLLPEALRLSFSRGNIKPRVKRNDPFSPYLRSSFTESIKNHKETQHLSLAFTSPLPVSIFSELSTDSIKNVTKVHSTLKIHKSSFLKSKHYFDSNIRDKSLSPKIALNAKTKIFLKRSKRSPATRPTYGNSKRFSPSSSNSRKFGGSSTFKQDSRFKSNTGFRSSTRSSANPTKSTYRQSLSSKSVPNFLSRTQRSKIALSSKSAVIKPTSTSSTYTLPSTRPRRFGKKDSDPIGKMEEDFEASEAIVQSITEEKIVPTTTSSARLRRPTKLPKFNPRSFSTSAQSRSNKLISPSSQRSRMQTKSAYPTTRRNKNSRNKEVEIRSSLIEASESTSTKRRFTLTTTFDISLKPTALLMTSVDDTDEGNNLQSEDSAKNKRKNKNRSSGASSRNRQGFSYKPVFDNDDNEVKPDKPKSLPLPVFGRSRGVKSRPKFDPRTIKATATTSTSAIIYLTSSLNETDDVAVKSISNGPITVTDVFTTVKTLQVHLGLRTSFATITTTAFSTSTINPADLTLLTLGGITKTILSAKTGFPDANLPIDKQFTVITEVILTTTEIESTSTVAIKVGFGTRTDTIVRKHKMTTLLTQTNTILEEKSAALQQHYPNPYFPNPFAPPPLPAHNTEFSLSLSENSFVSTQTLTSTTVLPLFFNGKSILTTLTSTFLSEETLVKTTTFKVPQQATMPPFVFPQPVFILPSVTTQLTVHFTAPNGEVLSIVTLITVPLALNGHTRFARSVTESYINPSATVSRLDESTVSASETYSNANTMERFEETGTGTFLQSSFSTHIKRALTNPITETPILTKTIDDTFKSLSDFNPVLKGAKNLEKHLSISKRTGFDKFDEENLNLNNVQFETYSFRKLLQINSDEDEVMSDEKENKEFSNTEEAIDVLDTQGSTSLLNEDYSYVPDTFHLIGPNFNEEGLGRPIPSVRVVPTRRAYVRRLNPSGSQNLPFDGNNDEFSFRRNNQNLPSNINVPPGNEFRPGLFSEENIGSRRIVPNLSSRPQINQEGPINNFGTLRNVQYFSPNRPSSPVDSERDVYSPARFTPNYASNRPNRVQDPQRNFGSGRNPSNFAPTRNIRPPQVDGYDAIRNLPSYAPTRQNFPSDPIREETVRNSNHFGEEAGQNQVNRPQPPVSPAPRRVIRLRRPSTSQPIRPQAGRELLDRKPIINTLSEEKEAVVRARGPVVPTNPTIIRDVKNNVEEDNDDNNDAYHYTEALPLTYYTTFTYMTTFLNGPSTAYSTREAVVSNTATETLNSKLVGLIRSRGGFTTLNGVQTAVPLGSRAQGATTTIVNLASRVQLYNSDVYYGKLSKPSAESLNEENIKPTSTTLRTVPITDVAILPKTYYTLYTYFYTLRDGDKSSHSQRSETISTVDTQTEPFILQDFASTVDSSGLLTLKPNKQMMNLGLRTAGGITTEVNLELKTVVYIDGLKNAVIDRGSMTPTLVEAMITETNSALNNYLDPDDAEVQDQQTYPQTVPIQPSFSSANEAYVGIQRSSSNKEATPEIPSNNRIIRTQSIRGPLRVASTILQRPGTLRSGVFAPRPGVRVRVRPISSRVVIPEEENLSSVQPVSSFDFESSRSISDDSNDFDEDSDVNEEDEREEYTTEDTKSTEEDENPEKISEKLNKYDKFMRINSIIIILTIIYLLTISLVSKSYF